MIELANVSKAFGSQRLFSGVNLRIGPRDRVGLVGQNGTGKTTLFRLMAGEMSPDLGQVERKKGLRIGYLSQEVSPRSSGDDSVLDHCMRESRGVGRLLDERAACLREIDKGNATQDVAARLAEADDRLRAARADSLPSEAESVLKGLGFSGDDLGRPISTMSGGLLMRVELARLLLDEPDILLLDEPTNHLDLEGLVWFEQYLAGFKGSFVMVTHDREFLNRTVSRIVEVSGRGVIEYGGNPNLPVYDRYVEERDKAVQLAWKRYDEQQARIAEIEDFIARNRVRKDRAQVVQSRIRQLEKTERLEPPEPVHSIRFKFPQPGRGPELVVELERAARRYGTKTVFRGLDLRLHRGEHVALVGVNGSGKSTLLRLIAGIARPDEGLCALGERVRVGYFAQDQMEVLDPAATLYDQVLEVADTETAPQVRTMLGAFLFGEDDIDKRVAALSGGEKARLMLARLLLRPCGLLVLDEPTNHLDISSREVLEYALKNHEGAVILTSHDRRFMDTVAGAVIEMKDGTVTRYEGNYSYYASKVTGAAAPSTDRPRETRVSQVSQRDLEREKKREEAEHRNRMYRLLKPLRDKVAVFEARIEALEAELKTLEDAMVSPEFYRDIATARATTLRAKELRASLDQAYDAWTTAAEELQKCDIR